MEARPDRFTAFVDANVLVPVLWRNLLLSPAEAGLYRLRLSEAVLAEVERAIPRANPRLDAAAAAEQVRRIRSAFPETLQEDVTLSAVARHNGVPSTQGPPRMSSWRIRRAPVIWRA
ncbi:MAG: hypothetical protein R6V44_03255 [Paracoccaceae bacterium]